MDKATQIANDGGIRILRGMKLSSVLLDTGNSEVIGGVWITDSTDTFSFDIAISKDYQNKGLSSILIRRAISEYREQEEVYKEMGNELKMEVDVINPKLERILKDRYGFYVTQKLGKDRVLMTI